MSLILHDLPVPPHQWTSPAFFQLERIIGWQLFVRLVTEASGGKALGEVLALKHDMQIRADHETIAGCVARLADSLLRHARPLADDIVPRLGKLVMGLEYAWLLGDRESFQEISRLCSHRPRLGRPAHSTTIPQSIFEDVYPRAYKMLRERSDTRPSQLTIAMELGIAERTFRRYLKRYRLPWPPA